MMKNEFNNDQQQLSKNSIAIALLELMKKTPYADITVTEIVKKAGVSRNAYYRNFSSKDDILIEFMKTCFYKSFLDKLDDSVIAGSLQWDELFFRHIYEFRDYLRTLFLQSDTYIILIRFLNNYFVSPFVGNIDDEYNEIARMSMQVSVIFTWVVKGCRETPEEIVKYVRKHRSLYTKMPHLTIGQMRERIDWID